MYSNTETHSSSAEALGFRIMSIFY